MLRAAMMTICCFLCQRNYKIAEILFLVVVAADLLVTGFLVNANMIAGKQQKTDMEHEKQ